MLRYPVDYSPELAFKGICGVLAIAVVGRVSLERAHELCKENMMPHQKRHVGGTYTEQRIKCLEALGLEIYYGDVGERITLRRFVERDCMRGKYMVTTTSHVVVVHNGTIMDQVEIAPAAQHRSKRCFVKHVVEIK